MPDSLLVTAVTIGGVRLVAAVDGKGEAAGLRPGQTLTNARALCPNLDVAEADPVGTYISPSEAVLS